MIDTSSPTVLALGAAVAWGVWAVLTKVATRTLDPEVVLVVSYLVAVGVGAGLVVVSPARVSVEPIGLVFALGAGVATGVGSGLYYTAIRRGAAGTVSTIVGLYFVVAVLLGVVFLREQITASKVAGIGFAVVAVALLAR